MYEAYVAGAGALPLGTDDVFLLWIEATEAGRPSEVLNLPAGEASYLAAKCLQWYSPLRYALSARPNPADDEAARIAKALAEGWGS